MGSLGNGIGEEGFGANKESISHFSRLVCGYAEVEKDSLSSTLMGATDSKLAFRKGVFRLFEERVGRTPLTARLAHSSSRTFPLLQMTIGLWYGPETLGIIVFPAHASCFCFLTLSIALSTLVLDITRICRRCVLAYRCK